MVIRPTRMPRIVWTRSRTTVRAVPVAPIIEFEINSLSLFIDPLSLFIDPRKQKNFQELIVCLCIFKE